MSLVAEVRSFYDKTILLSGCISNGRDVASALQMGADLAYMGTRFINVEESNADEGYRQMIIDSNASDIVYTAAISGVNANFFAPWFQKRWGLPRRNVGQLLKRLILAMNLDAKAEAKAWKTIWSAGQGSHLD